MPTRAHRKAASDRRARVALACFALAFIAGQAAFRVALARRPAIGDPEFGRKLDGLRTKVADDPRRPLVVMLGSSRVATGFRPDVLDGLTTADGRAVAAFNYAQVGTGPQIASLVLERMLEAGVRPDWVLVEFWPPFWCVDGYMQGYLDSLNLAALDWPAARTLGRYLPKARKLYEAWLPAQLAPVFASRAAILSRLGPSWAPKFDPERRLENLDPDGWWSPRATVSDADRARLTEHYHKVYAPRLARFAIRPTPDRALRDLLATCRREGIRAAVVVLPEGDGFRALYPPEALRRVDAYLDRLAAEERVPVVDARNWVGDEGFSDGHHLLPAGATAFTERLAREALAPLLHGEPAPLLARPGPSSAVR
jgi:hypothetical protein